ncbi:MAG TPA: sulfate adenylyltransferase subunit CysN [Burkholderiales bacterium]
MARASDLIATDIERYLHAHEHKSLLRFITCGSVDDGKSTLIGRLLHDSKMIYEDQLAAVTADSGKFGTTGSEPDLALLVDGLQSEREQGITIDVAYRYFSTDKRKFIIADTPGHVQYTRNMATGASTANLAVILIDAQGGVLAQTKRHSFIVSLLGIEHVIVAVNKMDLLDFRQDVFDEICRDYQEFAKGLDISDVRFVPISALRGDNVVDRSEHTPWYQGETLLHLLETVPITGELRLEALRFPVQYVNRPNPAFRGYAGTVASGTVRKGEEVMVLPARKTSRVRAIVTADGELEQASRGMAVTLTLEDELDISRGDMLVQPNNAPSVGANFDAQVVWMSEAPLMPGRQYDIKIGPKLTRGLVSEVHYRTNVDTLEPEAADELELNDIGLCALTLVEPVPFDAYRALPATGSFIFIDRQTNVTVGAGMITRGSKQPRLDRATNVTRHEHRVSKALRANQKGQKPCVLWFTGLSGSGKSTLSNALEHRLFTMGYHSYLLDGDNVRFGLNRDLGFTDEDRVENIRRIGETAKLFVDAGLIVLTAFISPFRSDRDMVRSLVEAQEFVEVYVNAPLEVCEQRDPKGLYSKARQGEISNFTGIDSPYEPPSDPEITLFTERETVEECVEKIITYLQAKEMLPL